MLALKLGMTVGEMSTRMGVNEMLDWIAFFNEGEGGADPGEMTPEQIAAVFGAKIQR